MTNITNKEFTMSDFLTITADNAPVPEQQAQKDPRFWKPTIKNKDKEYQAQVRLLPRGVDGIKNKLEPSVCLQTHHLKNLKHKVFLTIKCPKTLDEYAYCPICEAAWGIYNAGKAVNDKNMMKEGTSRLPTESHLINTFIRNDITQPANNGLVKIWEHTKKQNTVLFAPTKDAATDPNKKSLKKVEKFFPYSPKAGRDYVVIVTENPENGMASYESSEWDSEGFTDLASSNEEIMAILDKCYDLGEFFNDIPSTEVLAQKYTEFCNRVEEKERLALLNGKGGSSVGSTPAGNSAPAGKPATTGNAKDFFGGAKTNADAPKEEPPKPAPKAQQAVMEEESTLDEEELPF